MRRNLDLHILENEKGKPIFSFGKYKGNEVSEVLKNDPGYYSWIMKSDFQSTLKICSIKSGYQNLITRSHEDYLYR